MFPRLLLVPLIAVLMSSTAAKPVVEQVRVSPEEMERLVFFAVIEGLYTDGVSNEAVDIIVRMDPVAGKPEHFVYTCPLCHPAYDALVLYRARPPFYGKKLATDTFGKGLDESVMKKLRDKDQAVRLQAIQALIEKWVSQKLASKRLTPAEHKDWLEMIKEGREKGMAFLKKTQEGGGGQNWKGCAICDGAFGACERRRQ